ncbi:SDR family oxidoreductase [Prochlorococcus marinus]|uniref:Short-chain dehydrogenase n=1 Tax=Prochlorococcus marinus XMU1408 TaxID=2213228 RepID=A0A318R2F9_PROMR|nr:SDR family oxidoreductase [Prochlorococcus marinus]MBW3041101.1 short-chain dehydrogenase [Prochlorococcus marinus str. XMU1408]PYE03705.1 short-chain dehydrogenase [Prochlorococcus marinus XMU1408]
MSTYLITGANRGIGLELARQLRDRGEEVIATCRSTSSELNSLSIRVETGIDITSGESVIKLRKNLNDIKVDVLIQNAGIAEFNSLSNLDPQSIVHQFEVNALSPLCFVQSMISHLSHSAKIALISSRMGSIEDNSSGGSYGYRMSKVALCMAGKSLSVDLKSRDIAVAILHPGLVSTRMTGFTSNGIQPNESVKGLIQRIDELTLDNSGTFWHANGDILPW